MSEASCDASVFPGVTSVLQNLRLETPKVHNESRYAKWTESRLPAFASTRDPVFERVDSNILRRLTTLENLVSKLLDHTFNQGARGNYDDARGNYDNAQAPSGFDSNPTGGVPETSTLPEPAPPICTCNQLGCAPRAYRRRKNKKGPRRAAELSSTDGVISVS